MTGKKKVKMAFRISVAVFSLVVAGFLSYTTIVKINNTLAMHSQLGVVTSQKEQLETQKAALEAEIEKLQDSNYLANYAREHYVFLKDGERVSIIPNVDESE